MPSPKHKCAHPQCDKMITASATHCKKHVPHTKEWVEKQAAAQRGKKLSLEHRRKISEARSNRIEVKCQWCRKSFSVKPARLKKGWGKYCSNKCAYAARSGKNSQFWKGGKEGFTCHQCGKVFEDHACFHTGKYIFCSKSCKAIYYKAKQANCNTKIERIMKAALTNAGYTFQEQVPLCNVTIADFYLPEYGIVIFCDGDYWHSFPRRKKWDARQTKVLENAGLTVYRFSGTEIRESVYDCLAQINLPKEPPFRQLHLPTF